ncbi:MULTISPECIES: TlpA family protein disulfide reductase [unclassified Streptomyces]|uniref:TlpA family protein disulfide reductase n=1 Tax=unclassified Streptomyces TaxID=2593676 RepID=UPI0035C8DA97
MNACAEDDRTCGVRGGARGGERVRSAATAAEREGVPGVHHVEIDAEDRLELVRELEILKTPTVLVLDADGRIVRRATGQPRKADVIAALGEAV